jgi:mono/diheme cytochrome c family protein
MTAARWWLCLGIALSSVAPGLVMPGALGQDKAPAKQDGKKGYVVPPAPALSPAEEIKTFRIKPGYRVELIASEPLVNDPIAMTFDPDGRIWVVEMRGFMPDIDAKGEKEPSGSICVLEDTDGDGVMDKRTVFVDKLVLPRGLCWTTDGLLVAANGKIWLCRDSRGGLQCDSKELICDYNVGNPEHALNGLMPALDNWIYNAKEGLRLRKLEGKWVREATVPRGQWGITQDDHGVLIYNVNASLIRGDLIPCYSPSAHAVNPLVNVVLYKEQQVWPIRPNPGINRGYIPSYLRADGTMIEANANCGPVVYRGDNLPRELLGDIFINEPAGNLVRRQVFAEEKGVRYTKNAYDKSEFLASTDERFRPCNMYNAPDGTLYMVDMYRGIIQYGAFMTPYLRKDILERGLDKHIGLGRIFRIVHESTEPRKPVRLSKATGTELVAMLSSANGWHREMAQQLLVQRGDTSVAGELKKLALAGSRPLGRLHALWVLEGLNRLDSDFLFALLADSDAAVRASAACLCRNLLLRQPEPAFIQELAPLAADKDKNVRMQVALTLGLAPTALADATLEPILKEMAADPVMLEALLAGFAGRQPEFLAARLSLPSWAKEEPWRQKLLAASAGLLWRQRQPLTVLRFLHLVSGQSAEQGWQQIALLEGLTSMPLKAKAGGKLGPNPPRVVTLPAVPDGLEKLRKSPNARLAAAAESFAKQLVWPGKDGKPLPQPVPLSAKHQALFDLGRTEYMGLCAACHHPAGYGDAGKGPALLDSEWLDHDERLVRLVLHGLRGPVTIGGERFNPDGAMEMPGMLKALDDRKIAAILTFVRREWRDSAAPIEPELVARIRAATAARVDQWTEKELLEIK